MSDRPHVVIPGDVTSSFATSEELTGDAAHLTTLMRTARSRMVIATTSAALLPRCRHGTHLDAAGALRRRPDCDYLRRRH